MVFALEKCLSDSLYILHSDWSMREHYLWCLLGQRTSLHGHFYVQVSKQFLRNILKTIDSKVWSHLPLTYSQSHIVSIIPLLYYEQFYNGLPIHIYYPSIKTPFRQKEPGGICMVQLYLFWSLWSRFNIEINSNFFTMKLLWYQCTVTFTVLNHEKLFTK